MIFFVPKSKTCPMGVIGGHLGGHLGFSLKIINFHNFWTTQRTGTNKPSFQSKCDMRNWLGWLFSWLKQAEYIKRPKIWKKSDNFHWNSSKISTYINIKYKNSCRCNWKSKTCPIGSLVATLVAILEFFVPKSNTCPMGVIGGHLGSHLGFSLKIINCHNSWITQHSGTNELSFQSKCDIRNWLEWLFS